MEPVLHVSFPAVVLEYGPHCLHYTLVSTCPFQVLTNYEVKLCVSVSPQDVTAAFYCGRLVGAG